MLVVCINNKWGKLFSVGSTYWATQTYSAAHNGKEYWYHEFLHTGNGIGFRVENFAPVSDIDEIELVNIKEDIRKHPLTYDECFDASDN